MPFSAELGYNPPLAGIGAGTVPAWKTHWLNCQGPKPFR